PVRPVVVDVVVGELFGLAGSRRQKSQLSWGDLGLGYRPFSVGRESQCAAFPQQNRRRAVRLANVDAVGVAAGLGIGEGTSAAFFVKKQSLAVNREFSGIGVVEPGELALFIVTAKTH